MRTPEELAELARTDPRLSESAYRVLLAMLDLLAQGTTLIPRRLLRAATGLSLSTINRAQKALRNRGYLHSRFRGYLPSAASLGPLATHQYAGEVTHSSVEMEPKAENTSIMVQYRGTKVAFVGKTPPPLALYDVPHWKRRHIARKIAAHRRRKLA